MLEGLKISFSVNSDSYGFRIQNDRYDAYIGIKHPKKEHVHKKKLKPFRKPINKK